MLMEFFKARGRFRREVVVVLQRAAELVGDITDNGAPLPSIKRDLMLMLLFRQVEF